MKKIYVLLRVHETPYMREMTELCVNTFTVYSLLTFKSGIHTLYILQGKYIVTNIYVQNKK
jgi:hypothetical protein